MEQVVVSHTPAVALAQGLERGVEPPVGPQQRARESESVEHTGCLAQELDLGPALVAGHSEPPRAGQSSPPHGPAQLELVLGLGPGESAGLALACAPPRGLDLGLA